MIRQYCRSDTAQQILKEGKVHLGGGTMALHFSYQDRHGELQQVRIALGNLLPISLS
jgi:hypothetical protein